MNSHIELVKRWLADPDSVTQEEIKENAKAAWADANASGAARAAYYAADAAAEAVDYAAYDVKEAAADATETADYWARRYDEANS